MPILKEIKDIFDTFPQYPYADRSLIDRIRIAQNPSTNQYCITSYPGGCGSAYEGFVVEFVGVKELFEDKPLTQVHISRDYGPSLFLSVKNAVPKDGGTELNGKFVSTPKDSSMITNVNPNFYLFERLCAEIRQLQPDLQKLLAEYVPLSGNIKHFVYDFSGGSTRVNYEKKADITTFSKIMLLSDAARKGFGILIRNVEETPFKKEAPKIYKECLLIGLESAKEDPTSDIISQLGAEKISSFLVLEEKIKRLYQ